MKKLGLYIHIPFCENKCNYCDFYSITNKVHINEYIDVISKEISRQNNIFTSIYIGGGSPSLLSIKNITKIFNALNKLNLSNCEEITIEANPSQITAKKLNCWLNLGITRISIGIQSFNDNLLKKAGRIHTGLQAVESVKLAQKAGFKNISLDLIYGLPGEELKDLFEDIYKAASLSPTHISPYALMIEENTTFFKLLNDNKLNLPSDEIVEEMYDIVNNTLPSLGFNRYEISNFAKGGYECKHNLLYWNYNDYVGLGATAASFINNVRYKNTCSVEEYIHRVNNNLNVNTVEDRTFKEAMFEYIFLALRKVDGLNKENFQKKFGIDFENTFQNELKELKNLNLLFIKNDQICLTEKGFKVSNMVFEKFL